MRLWMIFFLQDAQQENIQVSPDAISAFLLWVFYNLKHNISPVSFFYNLKVTCYSLSAVFWKAQVGIW